MVAERETFSCIRDIGVKVDGQNVHNSRPTPDKSSLRKWQCLVEILELHLQIHGAIV